MTSERIKEIQEQTAYPESVSVMIALKQVWNECEQEQLAIQRVSNRRELLIAFAVEMQNIGFNAMDDAEKVVDIYLKSN